MYYNLEKTDCIANEYFKLTFFLISKYCQMSRTARLKKSSSDESKELSYAPPPVSSVVIILPKKSLYHNKEPIFIHYS